MGLGEGGWGKGGGVGWGKGVGWALGPWGALGRGWGVGGGGMAGPLVPIGPIDPFKGIPIVDPHLYGSAGSHFVWQFSLHTKCGDSDTVSCILPCTDIIPGLPYQKRASCPYK